MKHCLASRGGVELKLRRMPGPLYSAFRLWKWLGDCPIAALNMAEKALSLA